MNTAEKRVLSFHYKLTNTKGQTLDSSEGREPLLFMEGSGQIIPGLESEMLKLRVGDKKVIHVAAQDAYGLPDPTLKIKVPRTQFPAGFEMTAGAQVGARTSEGEQMFTIESFTDEEVTLDGNHPLAGEDLNFDIELMEDRPATKDELAHGHAHGPHGHHH